MDHSSNTDAGESNHTNDIPTTSAVTTSVITTDDSVGFSTAVDATGSNFDVPPDVGDVMCDNFEQNCNEGEKCAPWASPDGTWMGNKCVQIHGDGTAGEPCTAEGEGLTGVDDCALGHLCWNVDMLGQGKCYALCTGTSATPVCAEGFACLGMDIIWLCLRKCDPLLQDCPNSEVCVNVNEEFVCEPDASGDEGQFNDPCEYVNACDSGLVCSLSIKTSAACNQQIDGCCTPFCMIPDGPCPNPDQSCVPWHGFEPPPGEEDIGQCAIPR